MEIQVKTRKWGNSLGVILPKEFVQKEDIKENQEIRMIATKKGDLSNIFGALKGKIKMSGQEFKDKAREGWN